MLSESDGELFARHGFAAYHLRDSREQGFVLGRTEAVIRGMGRPVAKLAKAERRDIQRQIAGFEHVEGRAHGPGLHQAVVLPTSGSDVARRVAFPPSTWCQSA